MLELAANKILTGRAGRPEEHVFANEAEAAARFAFIAEALSWIGTPFRDCGDTKGPAGAVDCAMLLTRCAVDTGLVAPFDPRPYPPRWHVHRSEERFLDWIATTLGARETDRPRPGDVAVWMFGRTFSHGGIVIDGREVVHAYAANRMVVRTRRDEPLLSQIPLLGQSLPRPVKYFDLWSLRRGQSPEGEG